MGGESQKKWLGVGKLQKFKCNSQVQKNLLGLFLPFSQFLYRYYKMFSRSLFSQNRAQKVSRRTFWRMGVKCCFLVAVKISVAPDQGNTGPPWIKIRLLRRRYSDPSWGCRTRQWIKVPADGQRRSGQHIP